MKYTYCEAMMWHALTPGVFRRLKEKKADRDINALKKASKAIYRQMVGRTPNIGSLSENSLRICLSCGMVWLSVYEAANGKMDESCFAEIVKASMESPLIKGSFKKKEIFSAEAQQKRLENAKKGNAASKARLTGKQRLFPAVMPMNARLYIISAVCVHLGGRRDCSI